MKVNFGQLFQVALEQRFDCDSRPELGRVQQWFRSRRRAQVRRAAAQLRAVLSQNCPPRDLLTAIERVGAMSLPWWWPQTVRNFVSRRLGMWIRADVVSWCWGYWWSPEGRS